MALVLEAALLGGCAASSEEACQAGDVFQRVCGNCGVMSRSCEGGAWGAWSACAGEGECAVGATETGACGPSVGACVAGSRDRVCSGACTWGGWSACAGGVTPSAETCGNGIDENCNGVTDEGCSCNAVAPGAGGSFVITGQVAKLLADPGRCLVYGLRTGTPSQVVVFDTATKAELTRIELPQQATDFDLSPNGAHLVVAHDAVHQLSVVDLGLLSISSTIPVQSDPYQIAVSDAGLVYYAELDQWTDLRRVDPAAGIASDTLLSPWGAYAGDVALSPDGVFLYVGESGISGGSLTKYRVWDGGFVKTDVSTWDDGYGFPYPARHVYLSPGGQHVYYAGYQLDAGRLALVNGAVGERVLAEDRAGTFAVGERTVFDATLVRPVTTLPCQVAAAALASEDTELWSYCPATARMAYVNTADVVGDAVLGQREAPAGPLSSYTLVALVSDPVRSRLYGLDSAQGLVVAVDAASLQPTVAIKVGSTPTDLAVAPDGTALYVGHLGTLAIARIDLGRLAFDRFIPTPRAPYDVEVLAGSRLAAIDEDQWTTVTILDAPTGAVTASRSGFYEGALAATGDGTGLFVGEAFLSGSNIERFDVSAGTFVPVTGSTYNGGYGFPYPARSVVALADGSAAYYAGFLLDGGDLGILRYAQADAIRAVTPDGTLATSSTKVYRVADGSQLGALPTSGSVQAVRSDGKVLYVVGGPGIAAVDLTVF